MLNIILFLIVIGIIIVFLLASRQPDIFLITRSCKITAPVSAIFTHVNDLHKWDTWSPWAKLDPNAKNSYEGPAEGVGAKMSWAGNNKVGVGSMTLIESHLNEKIQFKLEFIKPMKATNIAEFLFTPEGEETNITWSMSGSNNFMGKVMGLFMNCDKMVGTQFEKGLADLKVVSEASK
jgi:hypothetical protein